MPTSVPRQQHKASLGVRQFDNLQLNVMRFGGLGHDVPSVDLIDIGDLDTLSGRLMDLAGKLINLCSVLLIGSNDVQRQKMTHRVDGDMNLRAFAVLGIIIAST